MDIFLDKAQSKLIESKESRSPIDQLRLGENVIDTLSLWLLDPPASAGLPLTPSALDASFTDIIFSGRPTDNFELPGNLFSCVDFTAVGAGETLHYEGLLQLNTEAVRNAMSGQKALPALVDVEVVNADATRNSRLVMHQPATLLRDIYRGEEQPVSGDPAYPLPGTILTTGPDAAKIKRGTAAVANGAESKAVAFATAFAAAPSTVMAWLMVPAAGALIQCAVDYSTITTAGFTALLGAATPNANYRLGWLAIA